MAAPETLTYAIVHLIAVFLQVVLDAALEEVQLGFQLLREAEHAVLTPGQVGVVAQEAQPEGDSSESESLVHTGNSCFSCRIT